MKMIRISAVLSLLLAAPTTWSSPIFYEVENVSGDTWQYTYTVGNETGFAIDWFTIWFDPELYLLSSDAEVDGPDGWDIFVAETEFLLPGDPDNQPGFFDACGFDDDSVPCFGDDVRVLVGELIGGFTVVFDWLGSGTPGRQLFTLDGLGIEDADAFTQPLPTTAVPEPATILLLGGGLCAIAVLRRRRTLPGGMRAV
jgi:hypothetical protein